MKHLVDQALEIIRTGTSVKFPKDKDIDFDVSSYDLSLWMEGNLYDKDELGVPVPVLDEDVPVLDEDKKKKRSREDRDSECVPEDKKRKIDVL
jgi:hypothetical protein